MEANEISLSDMDLHGIKWNFIGFHDESMECNGASPVHWAWIHMESSRISLDGMELHGIQ